MLYCCHLLAEYSGGGDMNPATQAIGVVTAVALVAVAIKLHEKPTNHVVDNSHIGEIIEMPKITHTHERR